jgi:hypothetical protein
MTDQTDQLAPVRLTILESHGIQRDKDGWDHFAYTVRLNRGDESIRVPWRQGLALTDSPTAADVLESLLSDAAGVENAESFEDWASEYGYDSDSRRAFATWEACKAQTDQLRDLLGEDYDSAVFPQDESPEEVVARLTA